MSVCANQTTFNSALKTAVKDVEEKERKDNMVARTVGGILYLILTIWAVMLAMKTDGNVRQLHMIFAFLFSPVYIIAYYLGEKA
jgi:heme/copper-type cytochrome/quinol oxidase subunit 4